MRQDGPAIYRMSPDVTLERFDDQALMLLSRQDAFLTVNSAAADLFELLNDKFAGAGFACSDMAALFTEHYQLTPSQAHEEARQLIAAWSEHGIIVPLQEV
jgi:hypothetical protein